jgi:hypothetical protein
MKNLISFASVVYLSFFSSIPDGIEAAVDQEIQTRVLRHLHIIPLKTSLPLPCSWCSFGSAQLMVSTVSLLLPLVLSTVSLCSCSNIPLSLILSIISVSALLIVFLCLCSCS